MCHRLVVVGDLAQLPSFLSCVGPPRYEELIKVAVQSPLYNLGLRRSISEYKENEEENMLVGSKRCVFYNSAVFRHLDVAEVV